MKNYNEINKQTYNNISKDWNEKRKYAWKNVITFLTNFENKENLKLLDLGCGTARHLELAEKLGFIKKNMVGSDFSEGQLKIVAEKGYNTKISDMINLEFNNEQFDIILCIAAHHHLLENSLQIKSLQEMHRILKKDGKILLCNWMPEKKFIQEQINKKKFEFIEDNRNNKIKVTYKFENIFHDRYYYLFKKNELEKMCEQIKFKIIDTQIFEGNIYIILIKT